MSRRFRGIPFSEGGGQHLAFQVEEILMKLTRMLICLQGQLEAQGSEGSNNGEE